MHHHHCVARVTDLFESEAEKEISLPKSQHGALMCETDINQAAGT